MRGCAKKENNEEKPQNVVLCCKQGANKQVILSWARYRMSIQVAANKAETKYDEHF